MSADNNAKRAKARNRSLLFTPANDLAKVRGSDRYNADWLVWDLEDAVAMHEKLSAREAVADALHRSSRKVCVRVNGAHTGLMEGDLATVVHANLGAVLVPKVANAAVLDRVSERLTKLEATRHLPNGEIRLFALVETASGVLEAADIARSGGGRLVALIFGTGDLALDLGASPGPGESELLYARSHVIVASRAAGLAPPIDGPYFKLRDMNGLRDDCLRSHRMGFRGRVVLHPDQLEIVNATYSARTAFSADVAAKICTTYEDALARGVGAIEVDGVFVDVAIYEQARSCLAAGESEICAA